MHVDFPPNARFSRIGYTHLGQIHIKSNDRYWTYGHVLSVFSGRDAILHHHIVSIIFTSSYCDSRLVDQASTDCGARSSWSIKHYTNVPADYQPTIGQWQETRSEDTFIPSLPCQTHHAHHVPNNRCRHTLVSRHNHTGHTMLQHRIDDFGGRSPLPRDI